MPLKLTNTVSYALPLECCLEHMVEECSTNVGGGCSDWDTYPVEYSSAAYESLTGGKAAVLVRKRERAITPEAGAAPHVEQHQEEHSPADPMKSLKGCLEAAAAENLHLRSLNQALEMMSFESAEMGGALARMLYAPCFDVVLSPGSVQAALYEFMWRRGQLVPDTVVQAFAKLPGEVIMALNGDFFERLHHLAAQWIEQKAESQWMSNAATTAIRTRGNFILRLFLGNPELLTSLLPVLVPPPPTTPRGRRMQRVLAATVPQLCLSSEQLDGFQRAWDSYTVNINTIFADIRKANQGLAAVGAGTNGVDSMHAGAKEALLAGKHAASIRRCHTRLSVAYLLLAKEVTSLLNWVQFAIIYQSALPYEPEIRMLCELVLGNAAPVAEDVLPPLKNDVVRSSTPDDDAAFPPLPPAPEIEVASQQPLKYFSMPLGGADDGSTATDPQNALEDLISECHLNSTITNI